jgi:SDR family mycofactocin-dependent oxidoreductase
MPAPLESKVAFVTGAARGQGRAHCLRLAREGADNNALDVCRQLDGVEYPMSDENDLADTVKLVTELGRRIVPGVADVRDRESMAGVLERGLAELGRLDFVIANAGVMPVFGEHSNEMSAWQVAIDVLLTGVMHTIELTYPTLVKQGEGGSVVITSSIAGMKPTIRTENAHTLGLLAYSAAKAALINLAENYASLLAPHRIRVNTVHPTGVNTPMIHNDMMARYWSTAHPDDLATLTQAMPVEWIEPEDVANVVFWLCSDESRYFTGNPVRIDAGASLR